MALVLGSRCYGYYVNSMGSNRFNYVVANKAYKIIRNNFNIFSFINNYYYYSRNS